MGCSVFLCVSERAHWYDTAAKLYYCTGHLPGFALVSEPGRFVQV